MSQTIAASKETLYRLRDTECNSRVFGPCEICKRDVVQVFHQVRSERWFAPQVGRLITVDRADAYGHHACLLTLR
jgi:hypothetical protein